MIHFIMYLHTHVPPSSHLEAGLRHLGEANDRVEVMRRELEELRPEIQQKTEVGQPTVPLVHTTIYRSEVCSPPI